MKKYFVFRKIHFLGFVFLISLFVSCQRAKVDPFDPTYDLGLVPADPQELVDGSSTLPSYFTGVLPASFTLAAPPVGDQKKQGSCTAWSAGYTVMSFNINRSNNGSYLSGVLGSPKFLFNLCKFSDCNSGSTYPAAFKVLKNKGICTLADMPYND
jgi:hypothetical protein